MAEQTPALKGLYGCLMGALLFLIFPLGIFLAIVGWVFGSGELTEIGLYAAGGGGLLGILLALPPMFMHITGRWPPGW